MIDWAELFRSYGPVIASVIGSILTAVFTLILWLVRWGWKKHKRQMLAIAKSIESTGQVLEAYQKQSALEYDKLRESLLAYRAELYLLKQTIEPLKAGMLSIEGQIKNQNDTINRYVEKMGIVSGKLDAVFRFIDRAVEPVPKRNTDAS